MDSVVGACYADSLVAISREQFLAEASHFEQIGGLEGVVSWERLAA